VCYSLQAQSAAAAAENSTLDAANFARMSHCIKALTAAQAAAQSFNLVMPLFCHDSCDCMIWLFWYVSSMLGDLHQIRNAGESSAP